MQRSGALTLSEAVLPRATLLVNTLLVLLGSAVVAVFAQITIWLEPVPITGQTFAVLLVGVTLGSKRGALALLAYLAEGLAGLPVFAEARSAWLPLNRFGEPPIFGSTVGYLLGFVIAAFVVGWLAERYGMDRAPWSAAILLLVGNVVLYVPGLIWLQMWLTAHGLETSVWQAGLVPFIPGDVAKLILAALAVPGAWRLVRKLAPLAEHPTVSFEREPAPRPTQPGPRTMPFAEIVEETVVVLRRIIFRRGHR